MVTTLLNTFSLYLVKHRTFFILQFILKPREYFIIKFGEEGNNINSIVIIKVKIIDHHPSKFKRQPYRVKCLCGNTYLDIVFFFARHPYIRSILPHGEERFISGKLEYFRNSFQITHPDDEHPFRSQRFEDLLQQKE